MSDDADPSDAKAPSDALVFFGATGDLAYKKIFPALQAMARRGRLELPVVGVAKSGWTLRPAGRARRAPASRSTAALDAARVREAGRAARATSTATTATRPPSRALESKLGARRAPAPLPGHPAEHVPDGDRAAARGRPAPTRRARRRREAVRPRSRLGARAQRDPAPRLPRGRRSSASITTSARRRCRTSSTSASPTRSSSRSGTGTTSRTCRSRWPRASASRGAASSTRRPASSATSSRTTSCRSSATSRWRRRRATLRRGHPRRAGEGAAQRTAARRRRHGPRAVSRLSRRAGRGEGLVHGDLRRPAPVRRLLALAGRPVLRARRQVPGRDAAPRSPSS